MTEQFPDASKSQQQAGADPKAQPVSQQPVQAGVDPQSHAGAQPPVQLPASQPILLRLVKLGSVITVVLAVLGGIFGYLVSGMPGLLGGVLGALVGGVCMGISAANIAVVNRFIGSPLYVQIFFGSILGQLLIKIVLFLVTALLLKDQPWLNSKVFFIAVVIGVIVSLILDLVVILRSKIPYASDTQLPG